MHVCVCAYIKVGVHEVCVRTIVVCNSYSGPMGCDFPVSILVKHQLQEPKIAVYALACNEFTLVLTNKC